MEFTHEFTIAIKSDSLQLTEVGLMYATRFVPSPVKRAFSSIAYSWAGETMDKNGQRWCLLRLQAKHDF
jgi:hypothetical protein